MLREKNPCHIKPGVLLAVLAIRDHIDRAALETGVRRIVEALARTVLSRHGKRVARRTFDTGVDAAGL